MSTPQPTATYLRRPPRETTAASAAADPTDPDRPVVDTEAAAEALRTTTATLHRLAQAGIVTPTRVDQHGSRWWNLRKLRRKIDDYLDKSGR